MSYAEAVVNAGYDESIAATVRKRRPSFAVFVARMADEKVPKIVLLGELEGGARFSRGQEFDWLKRMREDLEAFSIAMNKKQGWEASATRVDEWHHRIEEGVRRFMHEWCKKEGRSLQRDTSTEEGEGRR